MESEGQPLVVLRDPFRVLENPMTVTVTAYLLMTLMDGKRSLGEIEVAFFEKFKGRIDSKDVERFVGELDEAGLLFSDRFEEMRSEALLNFDLASVRDAAHAGEAYEADREALKKQLDGFYEGVEPPVLNGEVRAVIAPHIDPRVGGRCAAHAFAALRSLALPPDLFVLIGTAHQPSRELVILTEKDFRTPLGTVETDREVSARLKQGVPFDLKTDEFLHKYEHSLEFQVLFLQHLYGESHVFKILPLLVGSFGGFIEENMIPSMDMAVDAFGQGLREAVGGLGRRVCYVVGADLSHRGRKFGDDRDLSDAFLSETRQSDVEMLEHLERNDCEAFFRHLQCTGDEQKVCGLPPIYMMLHALGREPQGRLLDYHIHVEEQTQSFVSFASMVFFDGDGAAAS